MPGVVAGIVSAKGDGVPGGSSEEEDGVDESKRLTYSLIGEGRLL
jgi:hypothetical protein